MIKHAGRKMARIAKMHRFPLHIYNLKKKALEKKALKKVEVSKRLTKKILGRISKRFASARHNYYDKKEKAAIDDMLFSSEELPILGKEYWFLLFIEKKGKRQLMVTFGRGKLKGYSVNETSIEKKRDNSIFESWYYDNGVKEQPTRTTKTNVKKRGLSTFGDGVEFTFSGSYPKYEVCLKNEGKPTAKLKLKVPEKGERFEFVEYFKVMFGFGAISIFPEFKGTLNGKRFEGSCFVQKVVVTAPIIPWNWCRVHFRNGSVLSYFTLRIPKTPKKFWTALNFYDAESNKIHHFSGAKISKFGKSQTYVYLETESRDSELECVLKVYASKRFKMKNRILFNYTQYLVNVESVRFRTGRKVISEKDLDAGTGFMEDTDGILL